MKKVLHFLILICAFSGMTILNSANAQTWNCGAQGNNLTATLNGLGDTLTISGSGAMADYTIGYAPWHGLFSVVGLTLIIENGVTTI